MSRASTWSWIGSSIIHITLFVVCGSVVVEVTARPPTLDGSRIIESSLASQQQDPMEAQAAVSLQQPIERLDPTRVRPTESNRSVEVEVSSPAPLRPRPLTDAERQKLQEPPEVAQAKAKPIILPIKRRPSREPAHRNESQLDRQKRLPVAAEPVLRDQPRRHRHRDARPQPSQRRLSVEFEPIAAVAPAPPAKKIVESPKAKQVTQRQTQQQKSDASQAKSIVLGTTETQPAKPLQNTAPVYPPDAVRDGLQGLVMLRVTIAASGAVKKVAVLNSSGHQVLDRAAIDAVREWQFRPARREGRAVEWAVKLPIRFRL